ncbi:STAS domain-containing protein, partial [Streptomyces flavofungini]|uniref:STAS domain-containing protein n=1 Tax=Streptomyces flavofungini TaxID=68200 RepID=UPI0034DE26C4
PHPQHPQPPHPTEERERMSTDLHVTIIEEEGGRLAVATVAGELDVESAPAVYQQAMGPVTDHPAVILDLSQVTFCDSSGFNALLRLRRRAEEAGTWLALAAPPPAVERLLALTGADTVFPLYRTVAEARTHEPRRGRGDED